MSGACVMASEWMDPVGRLGWFLCADYGEGESCVETAVDSVWKLG